MRHTRARAPFHALRAALVATTMVGLAAAAHVIAGGDLPIPGIFGAVLALTGLAATAATRLKLNAAAMTGLLGTGQVVLHETFSALSGPAAAAYGGAPVRSHHQVPTLLPHPAGTLDHHDLDSGLALWMIAGHALATLICALLLARGEAALWSLAAWLRPLLRLPEALPAPRTAVPVLPFRDEPALPLPWRNLRRDCRRGPPRAVVV